MKTKDPDLWDRDLDWWLNESSRALGAAGTAGSVISRIERGGEGGSTQDPNLTMLARLGWKEEVTWDPKNSPVARERRTAPRWERLSIAEQRDAVAHYQVSLRLDSKVVSRFGELAGVAALIWVERCDTQRRDARQREVQGIGEALSPLTQQLTELERRIAALTSTRGKRRFRNRALAWFVALQAKPLRSATGHLLANQSAVFAVGSVGADLDALTRACERGEPAGLATAARRRVLALHAAWRATRHQLNRAEQGRALEWAGGID